MSVIDELLAGRLQILVIKPVTKEHDWEKDEIEYCLDAAKEFMGLAKLGDAALKAIKGRERRFTTICRELPPKISSEYCGVGCQWDDFCKLRAEGRR